MRYGHRLELWTAEGDTTAFSAAWKRAKPAIEDVGYSWTRLGSQLAPCYWGLPEPGPVEPARRAVEAALAEAAAERAEKARREADRIAAEVASCAPRAIPIRSDLTDVVRSHAWQLGRHLAYARTLLEDAAWREWDLRSAERLLSNARGNSVRAAHRLEGTALPHWHARAADPAVRVAALAACRHLSSLDTDWASDRNAIGWSSASCWAGHSLSERRELDQGAAGHALSLLHLHRRQLTDSQRHALFGEPEIPLQPALAL
ncbi:hypothetical protein [Methylobacterium indicum]|uniref:Uncharacterized protein n=1 Tax=Methylobacterium indicum TaxID=1775910 RepID=A0A8H8WP03_9HYPH|nr:hypothetical protein [Methylobacterium indicum]BCM81701.1 hypothetical protein mvi_01620 [Methylobacterium indicum]